MNLLAILEGLISSVPEAVELFHKITPFIGVKEDISQEHLDDINEAAGLAHSLVAKAHSAITDLLDTHTK